MPFKNLMSYINTEVVQLRELNFLMVEQANITNDFLKWAIKYCVEHKIPIWEEERFKTLTTDSKRIMEEIRSSSGKLEVHCKKIHPTDFDDKITDTDLTEPAWQED